MGGDRREFETWMARARVDRAERGLIEDAVRVEDIHRLIEAGLAGGCDVDPGEALKVRGRPPWRLRALVQQLRADGVIQNQVWSGGRRAAATVIAELARRYGVDPRLLKKALGDL
jgi:hypothetical protein